MCGHSAASPTNQCGQRPGSPVATAAPITPLHTPIASSSQLVSRRSASLHAEGRKASAACSSGVLVKACNTRRGHRAPGWDRGRRAFPGASQMLHLQPILASKPLPHHEVPQRPQRLVRSQHERRELRGSPLQQGQCQVCVSSAQGLAVKGMRAPKPS